MNFINTFNIIQSMRHRFSQSSVRERMKVKYMRDQLHVANCILQDADKGYVRFYIKGGKRQVQCDFDWFSQLTQGGEHVRVIVMRHCLMTALNILLGANHEKELNVDDELPVFLVSNGKPLIQYTFWGDSHVKVYEYDEE